MAFGKMDYSPDDATVTVWVYKTGDWRKSLISNAEMAMKLFPDVKFIRYHVPGLRDTPEETAEGAGFEPTTP